jgi:ssDNA-binding Zn-finger/Zn-ribbon topoisomerase 1
MDDVLETFEDGGTAELAVPFAYRSDGVPVRPAQAHRDTDYFCPACDEELIYRSGDIVRPHFAHRGDSPCSSPETILHHVAEHELAKAIEQWLDGEAPARVFVRECRVCREIVVDQKVPDSVTGVAVERAIRGEYQPDVILLAGQGDDAHAVAAFEVFVTHEIGETKSEGLDLPWIEVTAETVIQGRLPPASFEVRRDGLCNMMFAQSGQRLHTLRDRVDEILDRWNVDRTGNPYVIGIQERWSCGATIPVFKWGAPMHLTYRPLSSRPRTIKYRYSKTIGSKYWANTCPNCNRTQGDFPLRTRSGAAFGPTYDEKSILLRRAQEQVLL